MTDPTIRAMFAPAPGVTYLDAATLGACLVCVPVSEPERVRAVLDGERIRAAVRGAGIRFSVHLWNDDDDIERAGDAIRPFLQGPGADRA